MFLIDIKLEKCVIKLTLENVGILRFVGVCYKNKNMSNVAVDNFGHALEFVPDGSKTQKMCNKAVDTYPSVIQFVPECLRLEKYVTKLLTLVILYLIMSFCS